ncbi:MAG: hypothetical protein IKV03_05165 [Alphaproteobacteria bacterium]|nr:hypothetical protein [Alphaproteobacteria bacterium]
MQKMPENGRSMVEMLGTLAIIGVLSVGGIVGFNTAMDKYRVNNIWDFLHKTTALTHSIALTHPLSAENVQDVINELNSSYLATAVMCSYGYAVEMSGLPKGVCKLIASQANEDFYVEEAELYLGSDCTPGPIDCNSDDNNAISFIFDMTTNTDGTAEDAFYYCASNAIEKDGEKVARCQCNDSDVEIQYDSLQEAIDDLCQETFYSCSYNGDYIQRNGDVITNCECTTEGSFKTDEEAIMAMCAPYRCDGPKTIYQGNRFVNWAEKCECESSKGGHYDSDEEAIANMCQNTLRHYECSTGGFIYNKETNNTTFFTCFCGTSNWYSYYNSDEEAIANMCNPEISDPEISNPEISEAKIRYGCSSLGNYIHKDGYQELYLGCICKEEVGYYGSDEEAINAMCSNNGDYYCDTNGKLYQVGGGAVSSCLCALPGLRNYNSNSEAIAALCTGDIDYFCSDGDHLYRLGNDKVTSCNCINGNSSRYESDEDAIAAMCQNTSEISVPEISDPEISISEVTGYRCSEGNYIYGPNGYYVTTCYCTDNGTQYYDSDEEAIAAMCHYKCDGPCTIEQGDRLVKDCYACNCNTSKEGHYDSDEEAIAAMCYSRQYTCSAGGDFIYAGTDFKYTCLCDSGSSNYYASDEEAIAAMCKKTPKRYSCSGGNYIYGLEAGSSFFHTCNCASDGTGWWASSYYSDEEAIAAMCTKSAEYYCSSDGWLAKNLGDQSTRADDNYIMWDECNCTGSRNTYNSDEEAIANMCNPVPEISISEVAEYRCSAGGDYIYGPNGLVTTCYCTDNGTQYYASDEEAIAAMCQGGYYKCEGPITLFNGSRYVIPCDCNSSKAGYYDSDEEAIAAMCRYKCDGPCTIEQGYRIVKDCYACNCNTSKEGHYDSDEEAIAAMCKD